MLWHREIHSASRFYQDDMTTNLTEDNPAGPLKGLNGLFAGDIGETSHKSDGDDDLLLAVVKGLGTQGFLILSPEPGLNGFLDIDQRFLFVFALRDTTGQGRTLGYQPAVFDMFNGYVKQH